MHNTRRIIMIVPDLYEAPLRGVHAHFFLRPHELGKNAVVPLATLPENLVPFTMGGDIWRQFSYLGLHLEHLESWLQLSKAPLF